MFVNKSWLLLEFVVVGTTTFKQDEKQPLICTRTQTEYRAKTPVERGQVSAYKYNITIDVIFLSYLFA